uniref:Uncharacterized protein n=1 Tax=Candidatus Kentrum sp. TUN TaxID=2126343 RepID=A0A451AH84_9GAMM|nr:MAG: hypothetical protein BECKTUN1418D_GA0071000_13382 [Candidatus Kentron sp. TUN]
MRLEYKREDLGSGVRGKYYDAYNESHNLVLLTPEVARAFPSEEAVNQALLFLTRIAQALMGNDPAKLQKAYTADVLHRSQAPVWEIGGISLY